MFHEVAVENDDTHESTEETYQHQTCYSIPVIHCSTECKGIMYNVPHVKVTWNILRYSDTE